MQIVIGEHVAKVVAARWKQHYFRDGEWGLCFAGSERVFHALLSCGNTREEIDAIIGNNSWTHMFCEECKEWFERAIEIGEGYESKIFCEACLKKAVSMISGVTP